MSNAFSEQILADNLSKLNRTQQCIETLSQWCIFYRAKAEQVVATWNRQFHVSEMVHKVPLLYLANDILQNSKRKGSEFVIEFWKVLPAALKEVAKNGDDSGKNVVSRLISIWEERQVFGPHNLSDVMLREEEPPTLEFNKKRSRSVKITKRDSRSIRTKVTAGGTEEKLVSSFHSLVRQHPNEAAEMLKCQSAVARVRRLVEDVGSVSFSGQDFSKRDSLIKELEEEESVLRQCIQILKSVEECRSALVISLRDALHDQESLLENVRTQTQVAQGQADDAILLQKRLKGEKAQKKTAAATAAEVADKLAASTSSEMIMQAVLFKFASEEARNAELAKNSTSDVTHTSSASLSYNPI